MIMRVGSDMKNRRNELARREGKTKSQAPRKPIEGHARGKGVGTHIESLWDRIGRKLKSKGISTKDIQKKIEEARRSR